MTAQLTIGHLRGHRPRLQGDPSLWRQAATPGNMLRERRTLGRSEQQRFMPDVAHRLPIYDIEDDLVRELQSTRRVVLQAPTGSGKSTQTPQILMRRGFLNSGQAVILQPRRLATRLLASRVASEMGVT